MYAEKFQSVLRLAPLVFVRPGELRQAEWAEFDLDGAEWRIPPQRMKMRQVHIVPLARQSLDILRELHNFTGHGRYLFPSPRTDTRPISDVALLAALRRMGYRPVSGVSSWRSGAGLSCALWQVGREKETPVRTPGAHARCHQGPTA